MFTSENKRIKQAWEIVLHEMYDKGLVPEDVLSNEEARMQWFSNLSPTTQNELINKVGKISQAQRKEGGISIACGLLMLIVAGILLSTGYASSLPGERITAGLVFVGAVVLIRGVYRWQKS